MNKTNIQEYINSYLVNVYLCLAVMLLTFIIGIHFGSYVFNQINETVICCYIIFMIFTFGILFFSSSKLLTYLFSTSVGILYSPCFLIINKEHPHIVHMAFYITLIIFIILSLCGYYCSNKFMFYFTSTFLSFFFAHIFFTVYLLYHEMFNEKYIYEIYAILFLIMLCIIYDTTYMIHRAELNYLTGNIENDNYIFISRILFFDFIEIFFKIIEILINIKKVKNESFYSGDYFK